MVVSIIILSVIFLLLTGNFTLVDFCYGILLAVLITLLIRPGRVQPNWNRLPVFLAASLRYIFVLIIDLVKGGFQTARIVLDPKLPVQSGFINLPSECQSDLAIALSMHALTLTPGEIVIKVNPNNEFIVHSLDMSQSADTIDHAHRLRINLLRDIFL